MIAIVIGALAALALFVLPAAVGSLWDRLQGGTR